MMSRNPSQRVALVKYALVAPIFLMLVWAFTIPNNPLMRNTEGVSRAVENNVEKVGHQLFKTPKHLKVSVRGTEEGWVLPQNLSNVTGLNIDEGFEIIRFNVVVNKGDGYNSQATFKNNGAAFGKQLFDRGQQRSGIKVTWAPYYPGTP